MSNTYITVREFAKAVDKSPQAIYQQLETRLKPYTIVANNKTLINISAIEELYNIKATYQFTCQVDNPAETSSTSQFSKNKEKENFKYFEKNVNPSCQVDKFSASADFNKIIDILEVELKSKEDQLKVKDKQIEELNNRLADALQTLSQQQTLSAIDKKQIAAATEEEEQSEPPIKTKENKKSFFDFLKKFR